MNLYEFIQPSDSITFYSEDDDVAFAATMIVGNAHCFANRVGEDGKKTAVEGTSIYIGKVPDEIIERLKRLLDTRKDEIFAAFKTFAVCSPGCRKEYDVYTENSTNEERWKEWDDRKRTSMTNWCGYARSLKPCDEQEGGSHA
jgi:hypothetical protein